jgi:uracil-DNA glycosylase
MDFCPFELGPSWTQVLEAELAKPYIAELAAFTDKERKLSPVPIYPPKDLVFNAFKTTPFEKVRVLIIGQDPYHGPGQAHGLSFSVPMGIPQPPSLQNIFKEIQSDLGIQPPQHGSLLHWAEQGVMLLNATLTVRQGTPMSHHGQGWERFTDAVVDALIERKDPLVFVLWGKSAQKKCQALSAAPHKHLVLTAPHPSPFSAYQGFFGCKHFSKINDFLAKNGLKGINWVE